MAVDRQVRISARLPLRARLRIHWARFRVRVGLRPSDAQIDRLAAWCVEQADIEIGPQGERDKSAPRVADSP
jgi:hypothetical protein